MAKKKQTRIDIVNEAASSMVPNFSIKDAPHRVKVAFNRLPKEVKAIFYFLVGTLVHLAVKDISTSDSWWVSYLSVTLGAIADVFTYLNLRLDDES